MTLLRKRSDSNFTASRNREEEWRASCARSMGFEWVDVFETDEQQQPSSSSSSKVIHQVINLMDEEIEEEKVESISDFAPQDPWTENARRIHADLIRTAEWIQNKKHEYVSLDMADDEASLIQSTVTSFAATTAAELETLRKLIPNSQDDLAHHRSGIVQILLSQLQEQITEPFGILQKQRTRVSVQLWQNPSQCKLYRPTSKRSSQGSGSNTMMDIFDEETTGVTIKEQRFLPRHAPPYSHHRNFLADYTNSSNREGPSPQRPEFLDRLTQIHRSSTSNDQSFGDMPPSPSGPKTPLPPIAITPMKSTPMPYEKVPSQKEFQQEWEDDLQQESALLTVSMVQNDLDSVHKMEQRMVEITTLISQFSNLVSEQQEDILDIAHNAEKSKENVEKGKENLVDATERTKRSKHYLAWTIFGLSFLLLFSHTLRN